MLNCPWSKLVDEEWPCRPPLSGKPSSDLPTFVGRSCGRYRHKKGTKRTISGQKGVKGGLNQGAAAKSGQKCSETPFRGVSGAFLPFLANRLERPKPLVKPRLKGQDWPGMASSGLLGTFSSKYCSNWPELTSPYRRDCPRGQCF